MVSQNIQYDAPLIQDGSLIWALIRDTRVLDLNSPYSYLMLCKWFADTCVVARSGEEIVGFVSAFRPPAKLDTIFVWQVAVAKSRQGRGIGKQLVRSILQRDACSAVSYLEATVSPSNKQSQALFRGLARDLGTACEVMECFPACLFPEGKHEDELTLRIGPLRTHTLKGEV